MNAKQNKSTKKHITLVLIIATFFLSITTVKAQVPDPNQGLRASWMRGAVGLLWLPERTFNGNIEGIRIDDFITQIKDLRTIDYVQLPLTSPNIFSPTHVGPHPIIESLWRGDTDSKGEPINLVVPRESVDDPLLNWLKAVRAAGLKTEIYVNSYNLLARIPTDTQADYPDVSARWMEWCDTNPEAQAFINSQTYHDGAGRRKYMFCYAQFILKVYAERYGDLIDAWCFDSADNIMEGECGDHADSEDVNEQRIYQAFADACHAGNPNAAIAFNNSVGVDGAPFATATLFDDYSFGHPFGGAGNMAVPESLYTRNFAICQFMKDTNGYSFRTDARNWNDNVVGHFFPKQSTSSWNAGSTPCLTDEQFVEWTRTGIMNAGAITWGTPLVRTNLENSPVLTLQPYALNQFALTDAYLKQYQSPGAPNWSRQYTILPAVYPGQPYTHTLVEGVDFWDPEGVGITGLSVATGTLPTWLTITNTAAGVWTLSGTPTAAEASDYTFELRAQDADGGTNREVKLQVISHPAGFTNPGNGTPIWISNPIILTNAIALTNYTSHLDLGVHYYDFEGDALTITKIAGPSWLNLTKVSEGTWSLSGSPTAANGGENSFTFRVSDGMNTSDTEIKITVDHAPGFTNLGNGTPVWSSSLLSLTDGKVSLNYNYTMQLGTQFYDFEGDALTITKTAGAAWLNIVETTPGVWKFSGIPTLTDEGVNSFTLTLSDGVNSSTTEIRITVIPTVITDGNVLIIPTASKNYGLNTVATLYSSILTAPDGLASFRISVDVTPPTDRAIISGTSGGITTSTSWGIGDGTDATQNTLFRGSDNEWTESIGNIKIIDFNANGGSLTTDKATVFFKSITVGNAQSVNDFVSLKVGGVTSNPGRLASQNQIIDLTLATSVSNITNFAIGTGNTSDTNKWSVEGIIVALDFEGKLSTTNLKLVDTESIKLFPNPAIDKISFDMPIHSAKIIDASGKVIKVNASETKTLNVADLTTGTYIIKGISNDGKSIVKRFIKK